MAAVMDRFLIHKVTVHNPTESLSEDLYGTRTPEDDPGTIWSARMTQDTTETATQESRSAVITGWSVRLPPEAVITADSIVVWEGKRFTVEGEPALKWKPRGGLSHIRAKLERVVE